MRNSTTRYRHSAKFFTRVCGFLLTGGEDIASMYVPVLSFESQRVGFSVGVAILASGYCGPEQAQYLFLGKPCQENSVLHVWELSVRGLRR